MIVYKGTKKDFMTLGGGWKLADTIAANMGKEPNPENSEYRSWEASFDPINRLMDSSLPDDLGISIEYKLEIGYFRIDYFFTGKDKKDKPVGMILELKQWSQKSLSISPGQPMVLHLKSGNYGKDTQLVHPSYQAWSYRAMLDNYNAEVQDLPVRLSSCAYLFNYLVKQNDILRQSQFSDIIGKSPLYGRTDENALKKDLEELFRKGDERFEIIDTIDGKAR